MERRLASWRSSAATLAAVFHLVLCIPKNEELSASIPIASLYLMWVGMVTRAGVHNVVLLLCWSLVKCPSLPLFRKMPAALFMGHLIIALASLGSEMRTLGVSSVTAPGSSLAI